MAITLRPTAATFGAVVTDVELARLDDPTWAEVHKAFLEYGVLIFPGQHLSTEAQGAFARRFGNIEQLAPKQAGPNIAISNQKPDGSLAEPGSAHFEILKGNEGWHTDSTYMPLASKAAMLAAMVIPPQGGETEFADMRAAWDALDADTQAKLTDLSAYHSLYYSQSRAGFSYERDNRYGFHDKGAPLRPVVKTHPETGRKSLYTGRHAYGIPGMAADESEKLLEELLHQACQSPRVITHKWQVGDIVVWDNRCVMHRARPYDAAQPRVLRGTRIAGEPESELAPTFEDARAGAFRPSSSNETTANA